MIHYALYCVYISLWEKKYKAHVIMTTQMIGCIRTTYDVCASEPMCAQYTLPTTLVIWKHCISFDTEVEHSKAHLVLGFNDYLWITRACSRTGCSFGNRVSTYAQLYSFVFFLTDLRSFVIWFMALFIFWLHGVHRLTLIRVVSVLTTSRVIISITTAINSA